MLRSYEHQLETSRYLPFGRDRQELRDQPDPDHLVDRERLDVDPVDVAVGVTGGLGAGGSAVVGSLRSESAAVHRVVGDVDVLGVGGERRLDRRPVRDPRVPRDPEVRHLDRVGNRLDQRSVAVVDRDRVRVHHVLREHEAGIGCVDRFWRDVPADRLPQRQSPLIRRRPRRHAFERRHRRRPPVLVQGGHGRRCASRPNRRARSRSRSRPRSRRPSPALRLGDGGSPSERAGAARAESRPAASAVQRCSLGSPAPLARRERYRP